MSVQYLWTLLFSLNVFVGSNIWFYRDNKLLENSSQTLQEFLGNTMDRNKVNAALLWRKYLLVVSLQIILHF